MIVLYIPKICINLVNFVRKLNLYSNIRNIVSPETTTLLEKAITWGILQAL
jgi:hypothetical protein